MLDDWPVHHSFIDRYSNLKSPIHRLNPRLKVIVAFTTIVLVIIIPKGNFFVFSLFFAAAFSSWFASRLPFKHLIERLSLTIPFVAVMGIGMVFGYNSQGIPWWHSFFYLLLRSTLAIMFLTLLTSTTPFPILLETLRWFKLPNVLHSLLSFNYRFIYIIIDEFQRLNRGRKSREFGQRSRLSWRGRSWMLGTFFIRSLERSERVYQAMLSRGYHSRP